MGFELEGLKLGVDNSVSKFNLEEVNNKFTDYTPIVKYKDLLDDVKDNVKKD